MSRRACELTARTSKRMFCARLVGQKDANCAHLISGVRAVRACLRGICVELTNRAHPPLTPRGVCGQLAATPEPTARTKLVRARSSISSHLRWGRGVVGNGLEMICEVRGNGPARFREGKDQFHRIGTWWENGQSGGIGNGRQIGQSLFCLSERYRWPCFLSSRRWLKLCL